MGIADKIRAKAEHIKHKAQDMTTDDKRDDGKGGTAEQGVGENGRTANDTVDLDAPADRISETRNATVHSDKLQGL